MWTPFTIRLRARLLLRIASVLLFAFQVVSTILLAVWGEYKMNMYTYWSYTILTAFYAILFLATLVEHLVLTLTVVLALPLILGNVVFVAVAIIVILANDAEAYRRHSVCDTPPGKTTLEALHTGDWIIHGGPVFGVMLLLLCGLEFFSQHIIVRQLRAWNAASQWLYWLYWMLAPLVLITIYQLIFDVDKLYPTSFTVAERTLILAAIVLVWQTITWLIFTQVAAPAQLHAHALPTAHDVLKHSRLHGHWTKNPDAPPETEVGLEL